MKFKNVSASVHAKNIISFNPISSIDATKSLKSTLHTFFGFHQNCRGLKTKLTQFRCNVTSSEYLFMVLTETWLHDAILDYELGLFNYNIYRCDRSYLSSIYMEFRKKKQVKKSNKKKSK